MSARAVLHVEDNPDDAFLFLTAAQQASAPFSVHAVPDGREAIAWLSGSGKYADRERYPLPGAVLLDSNLPPAGGLEVLAWARQQEHLKKLPIIVISGTRVPNEEARALQMGAAAYLEKTPLYQDTLRVLGQLLTRSSG